MKWIIFFLKWLELDRTSSGNKYIFFNIVISNVKITETQVKVSLIITVPYNCDVIFF